MNVRNSEEAPTRAYWRQDSGPGRGARLAAHWTVMPSRRIIAMNPVMEKKIAIAVRPYVTAERSSTKERSDDEMSNQNTRPALSIRTVAQRTEIRMKNRRTRGRLMIAGSMGQKSWAKRCVNGRPTTAETSRATEIATVPAVGCAK